MRCHRSVLVVTGVLVLSAGPLALPGNADAATAQGWWSSAHQGVQPPAPPDVPEDGLLVQGAAARPIAPGAPAPGGTPAEQVSVQALSALTFSVPAGARVQSLTLKIVGDPPERATVSACLVTRPYTPVQNGAFADRPPFDCTTTVAPVLDTVAGTLAFGTDLAGLVRGGRLSVVLVPGELDRLVLQKPDATALTLARSNGTAAPGPVSTAPSQSPGQEPPASVDGFTPAGPSLGGVGVPLDPPAFGSSGPASSAQPEVAAPAAAPPVLGGPKTGPTRPTARPALDGSTRTALLLGLLAVGAAYMLGSRQPAAPTAGAQAAQAPMTPQERGVGRFRQLRHDRAVPL